MFQRHAGIETLDLLDDAAYERLEASSARLQDGMDRAVAEAGIRACSNRVGSMMTLFFGVDSVTDFAGNEAETRVETAQQKVEDRRAGCRVKADQRN